MKTMIISEFKAKCIATLKQVEKQHTSVTVTLRGKPIAIIDPVAPNQPRALGTQAGSVKIFGDIIHGDFEADWAVQPDAQAPPATDGKP